MWCRCIVPDKVWLTWDAEGDYLLWDAEPINKDGVWSPASLFANCEPISEGAAAMLL